MANSALWVDILANVLRRHHARAPLAGRPDFKQVCAEIESELERQSIGSANAEWQATKEIMRTIYTKTRAAEKNGYDFYQYALTPYLKDMQSRGQLRSPAIQQAVGQWCGALGWQRASIVDWTSVLATVENGRARFPYIADEFAVRLEGLGKVIRPENTQSVRPPMVARRFPGQQ